MEKTFSEVLCLDESNNLLKKDDPQGGVAGGSSTLPSMQVCDETPSPMTGKVVKVSEAGDAEDGKAIDMLPFLKKLSEVKENILKVKNVIFYATVFGNQIEIEHLVKNLKIDWSFLHGDLHISPKSNRWFEIRFANPIDQKRSWDGRLFPALDQLPLLNTWKSFCDAATE